MLRYRPRSSLPGCIPRFLEHAGASVRRQGSNSASLPSRPIISNPILQPGFANRPKWRPRWRPRPRPIDPAP